MRRVHHLRRPTTAILAVAVAGALGMACDPAPTFPAPAQPLVGEVLFERALTMDTASIDLRTEVATFHIDPGTLPVGSTLLVRILDRVVKDLTDGTTGDVWNISGQP